MGFTRGLPVIILARAVILRHQRHDVTFRFVFNGTQAGKIFGVKFCI